MIHYPFLEIAEDLEIAGLVWQPEVGDEISSRERRGNVSILVDSQGLTPKELRATYLWLPTVEQLMRQFEARQAILHHAGLELSERELHYKTVVKLRGQNVEAIGESLRTALGAALRSVLLESNPNQVN